MGCVHDYDTLMAGYLKMWSDFDGSTIVQNGLYRSGSRLIVCVHASLESRLYSYLYNKQHTKGT